MLLKNVCRSVLILWLGWVLASVSWSQTGQVVEGNNNQLEPSEPTGEFFSRWQQISRLEKQALNRYQKQILQNWPKPLVSNVTTWVEYDNQFQIRRVVDFEANEVRVSLMNRVLDQTVDYATMDDLVYDQLVKVLSSRISDALKRDPLYQAIEKTTGQGSLSNEMVFSELFTSINPSQAEIEKLARKLFSRSFVQLDQRAATTNPIKLKKASTYVMPLPEDRLLKKARQYKAIVKQESQKANVDSSIMFAMIHTESHFNPLAKSPIPAYGLMQIVPASGGRDASKVLFKNSKLLSPKYLYDPKNNIRVGTTYFNILYYKYFSGVKSQAARLYLSIAAYNAGIRKTARVFHRSGKLSDAVPEINKLSDKVLLTKLSKDIPYRETRQYIKHVLSRANQYKYL